MYLSHYGLQKKPFDISPDPSFLWLGEKHREALSYLKYGILENKGFLMITGDVGTGKTALIKRLTRLIDAATFVVTVPDPDMDRLDFFNFLADELGMNRTFQSKGEFLIHFKHFLKDAYSEHRKVLLIIDESQRLNHELLQEIRLLSNIDLGGQVLLNIFFVGQTEFNQILKEERNRTVRQRITASFHLDPLNAEEVKNYIVHRLRIAGASNQIFTDEAIRRVFEYTDGYPRLINILCDHALMTGYASGATAILPSMVDECAEELSITFGTEWLPRLRIRSEVGPDTDEDLEQVVLAAPDTEFDQPRPGLHTEAVVKQMALAAGETPKIISAAACTCRGGSFHADGITYFAYGPVRDYVAGRSQIEAKPPSLDSFAAKDAGTAAAPAGSTADEQRTLVAENPVATEIPTAFKSSVENVPAITQKAVAPDEVRKQGSQVIPQNGSEAENLQATVQQGTTEAAPADRSENSSAKGPETVRSEGGTAELPQASNAGGRQANAAAPQRAVIFFEHDSHDLPREAATELVRLADAASLSADAEIFIIGYTDSLGNEWYNRKLSQTRADMVRDFFVQRGIQTDKIKAVGMGSESPLASNTTVDGRKKNRRVEIYLGSAVN